MSTLFYIANIALSLYIYRPVEGNVEDKLISDMNGEDCEYYYADEGLMKMLTMVLGMII